MATTDLSPIAGKTVRTPDGKNYRIPAGATQDQVSRFFAARKPAPVATPPVAQPMPGVVGGSSTATRTQPAAPTTGNPIVRGFTGTIYGGNVAGAGRTIKAAGAATGIPAVERAGQALQAHGERFTSPAPPDIFQIAPNDPAGRQKVMDFLGYQLGSGLASTIPSVLGAAAGNAAVGAMAGPAGATVGALRGGAIAGAAIPSYLMNTGSVQEEIEKITGGTTQGRARLALLIGMPITALDTISPIDFGPRLTRFLLRQSVAEAAGKVATNTGLWEAVKAGAKGIGSGALKESIPEGIQEGIQAKGVEAATGHKLADGELGQRTASAMIGGALTGGVLGTTAALPQRGAPAPEVTRSQARAVRRAARPPAPAEEAQTLAVRPPPLPAEGAALPQVSEPVQQAESAPARPAGAPTEIQARIAALETQVRKRPNEPKLRRRLEALKAEQEAKVGPENEQHAAIQAKIASAPRRIASLEKQIAETPNDKRAGKWRARAEELKALVETGRPRVKPAVSSPSKAPSKAVDTQPAPTASPVAPVAGKPSGSEPAAIAKTGRAAPVPTAGSKDRPAALPQTTPKPAVAPEAPARRMVPGYQFSDEAAAERVARGIFKTEPGADPKVVRTKKGFEIEVNEEAGASRLKKQSFVKVAPKNPAPDVVAAAEPKPVAAPQPAPESRRPKGNSPEGGGTGAADPGGVGKEGVEHPPLDDVMIADAAASSGVAKRLAAMVKSGASDGEIRAALVERFGMGGGSHSGKTSYTYAVENGEPVLNVPGARGFRADKKIGGADLVRRVREGLGIPQPTVAEVPRGTRNYQPGERLTVPYSGRSKTLTNERATFKGYVDVGGVPHVMVEVQRGKGVESRTLPESQVRRRPKIDRRPAAGRNPGMAQKARDEAGVDVEKARELVERAQATFDRLEKEAKAAYPHAGEEPNPEYRGLRARMRKAHDALEVAKGVVRELEPEPNFEARIDEAMKEWMADPERGAINLADLRAALVAAGKRLSGKLRRDPAVKAAAKVKYQPPPVVVKMLAAIKEAIPVREGQESSNVAERARRAQLAGKRRKGKYGVEELRALTSAHSGEFPKIDFKSIASAFSKDDIDQLTHLIVRHPALSQFEQMRAGVALQKLFGEAGGEVPERNEIELLEIVFGPEFVEAMSKLRPQLLSWKAAGLAFIDVSRALQTSFDLSAAARQGSFLAPSFPKEYAQAFVAMHQFWASEENFRASIRNMQQDPLFKYARQAHLDAKDRVNPLAITRASTAGGEALLESGEEAFFGANLAEKLHEILPEAADRLEKSKLPGAGAVRVAGKIANRPLRIVSSGVRRSERGYVGFLNQFRFDVFKQLFRAALATRRVKVSQAIKRGVRGEALRRVMDENDPRKNAKLLQEITSFINAGTGRGDSKFIAKHASLLARVFWSARFIQSRLHLMNPKNYISKEPFVRRQYVKSMLKAQGTAALMLTLAAWMGADIELNRNSPDFLKIRVRGIVYDILGGFAQYLRFFPSLAETLRDQQRTGKRKAADAYVLLERFVGNKLVSALQYVNGFLHGHATERDDRGKRGPFKIPKETLKLFVPMATEDFFEVLRSDPSQLPASASASFYGVGVQSYKRPGGDQRKRFPRYQPPSAP